MPTSLSEGAAKRVLAYLQPKEDDSVYARTWSQSSDENQRQLVTYVPFDGYQHEISLLVQYLEEEFGLSSVRNIDELTPGKFYLAHTQTEPSLKMIPDSVMPEKIMPFQLVFHADDQQRIMDSVATQLDKLKDVQAAPVPRRPAGGVGVGLS